MFGFGRKKKAEPVVYKRQDHPISRKNIDPDALKVLYRLSALKYTAYLVGGGVRDLLLGRKPKDFDVGTSAKPNEVKKAFRNCFLVGKRFRLAHIRFGEKVIETATFRRNSQTVGEIIEHAAEGPLEDNTFGTPETDAFRRDFTINGLFYNIKDFTVIDYVGGMKDLKKGIIRSIGDPAIRFREDPVRMMRAIKFAARLGFKIEKSAWKAMEKYHEYILSASQPRVQEEVFRLFPYGKSAEAFYMLYDCGMMHDLIPELADFIKTNGGKKCKVFDYLRGLDKYELMMAERGYEVSNAIRAAVLMSAMGTDGRTVMHVLLERLRVPKTVYFTGAILIDSMRRLKISPKKGKQRFIYNRDFLDALDFNRIIARVNGEDESILNEWSDLYDKKGK